MEENLKVIVDEIQKIMITNHWTLSVAESLTSGNLQALLASISDSSKYFQGGITAYSIKQKTHHLGINEPHAKQVNCVSHRVAQEMAIGITQLYGTKFGIATTGYASKYPEQNISEPFAYVAIYDKSKNTVFSKKIDGRGMARTEMQMHISETTLTLFHDYLNSHNYRFSRYLRMRKVSSSGRSRWRNRAVLTAD